MDPSLQRFRLENSYSNSNSSLICFSNNIVSNVYFYNLSSKQHVICDICNLCRLCHLCPLSVHVDAQDEAGDDSAAL
jgi:hypothetical protein